MSTEAIERLGSRGCLSGPRSADRSSCRRLGGPRDEGRELVLRRARGYAPLPAAFEESAPLRSGGWRPSQEQRGIERRRRGLHQPAYRRFGQPPGVSGVPPGVGRSVSRLWEAEPEAVACDLHPDYLSTKHAHRCAASPSRVQHHWAHVVSCMAENEIGPPVLGICWDGTGYGPRRHHLGRRILADPWNSFERVARFRHFRLPGGEAAVRQPSRTALRILFEVWGSRAAGAELIFRPFAISRPGSAGLSRECWPRASIRPGLQAQGGCSMRWPR